MPTSISLNNAQRFIPENLINPAKDTQGEHQYLRASNSAEESVSKTDPAAAKSIDAVAQGSKNEKVSEQLIATTLIKPILTAARESNNAEPPFGPTQAEKQFGSLLDNRLADDLVSSLNLSIAQHMRRTLDERGEALDQANPGRNGTNNTEPADRTPISILG